MNIGIAEMIRTIISIAADEKRWLDLYGHRHGLSGAEIVRRAIKQYRRLAAEQGNLQRVLHETSGAWKSHKRDSQSEIDSLRAEWGRRA
jgi:hypothetical protein